MPWASQQAGGTVYACFSHAGKQQESTMMLSTKPLQEPGQGLWPSRGVPELRAWGRNKEAACPAAGSRANRALSSKPLLEICVCFGWGAACQELGEKQTTPCMLPARFCLQHRVMVPVCGSKEHSGKTTSLTRKSSGNGCPQWLRGSGAQTIHSPQQHAENLHHGAPVPHQQVSVSQAVNIPCSQPDWGVCL